MKTTRSGHAVSMAYGSVLWLAACATDTRVTVIDNKYSSPDSSCQMAFFDRTYPNSSYETIAKIESHIQKNLFFGGVAKLKEDARAELLKKACAVGGNGIVIDDYVESAASEFSHVHVWATVIRFK